MNKGTRIQPRFADENYDKPSIKRTAYLARTVNSEPEPQTFDEAVSHPVYREKWKKAIMEKYQTMLKNKV